MRMRMMLGSVKKKKHPKPSPFRMNINKPSFQVQSAKVLKSIDDAIVEYEKEEKTKEKTF